MSKISSISGFPEWLPEHKAIEDSLIARVKSVYASYGYTPIETPAVELMSTLASKGVIDKEIFQVTRALGDKDAEAELGLHFDLTVPFARYVGQHFNELQFPFKRYQLQKVWRGDRPQRGRFREFYQFDIDLIARETLPLSCDAEVLEVLDAAFSAIGVAKYTIKLNNRKLLLGCYRSLGLSEAQRKSAIIAVDKANKIGWDGVQKELCDHLKLELPIAHRIIEFSKNKIPFSSFVGTLAGSLPDDEWCREGLAELVSIRQWLPPAALDRFELDLSLARGLDYYTGIIVEAHLNDFPEFGAVAAGGRYEDLASQFINKKLPGVGISIGLTRLMDLIVSENLIPAERRSPTQVLVAVFNEDQRPRCNEVARELRRSGVPAEVFFTAPKLGKQIDYADSKKIPFVLFVSEDGLEIKNLQTKEQSPVSDLSAWAKAHTIRQGIAA